MKLKEGIVLRPFGPTSKIDNSNLTDELYNWLIQTKKAQKNQFTKGSANSDENSEENKTEEKK